jgi:Protein of unknown function (DUF4239)
MGRETWMLLVAGAAAAGVAGAIAWFLRDREREPEDVTIGFIGPSLAAMYLLVLALALATEWQTIGSAQQAVGNEAVAVRQIYWAASGLPPAAGNTLRAQVRGYVTTVIDHDWPEMERGALDDASQKLLTAMSTSLLRVRTVTSRGANAQQYATSQLSALAASRAQRQSAAESRLPLGVLIAVIVTALIVGAFPFFTGIRPDTTSVSVAVVQAALVAIAAVVVFQLNNPFTGPLATGPGPISAAAAEVGAQLEPASCRSARRSPSLLRCCWSSCPRIPMPRKAAVPGRTRPGSCVWHRRGITGPHTTGARLRF